MEWAKAIYGTKKFFIVHGDDKVCDEFAALLRQELGVDAVAPYSGDSYELLTGEQIEVGNRVQVEKKKSTKMRASSNVFARLLAAGQRLLTVINRCEGMPNKELGKFADQINSLCDKWER